MQKVRRRSGSVGSPDGGADSPADGSIQVHPAERTAAGERRTPWATWREREERDQATPGMPGSAEPHATWVPKEPPRARAGRGRPGTQGEENKPTIV